MTSPSRSQVWPAAGGAPGLQASRSEDRRLVTGTGRFTADWHYPGELHAAIVRSDRAHARLLAADWPALRAAPGVVAVLTAQDVADAGFRGVPVGAPVPGRGGSPQRAVPLPVLATDRVRFVGQAIAMVIAESADAARLAADSVIVDYEELPVAVDPQAAAADGASQLHEQVPGNLSLEFESGDEARVEEAFAQAAYVSRLRIDSQRLVGAPMELKACVAIHDVVRGRTTIHTATQGAGGMRSSLAAITGWPAADIEVVAQDVGGSFGLRGGATGEHVLVMLAARRLGRPVRWVASRSELFISEWHGRALTLHGALALDRDGGMLAIRFDDVADLGAYTCYWGANIGTRGLAVTMGGVYRVPALYMRSRLYYTNTVPVSAYRGAGRPDIAYAIEALVDHAAAEHGFDPVALRRRNFIAADAFPYRTANGTTYDCGDFEAVLDHALRVADHAGFEARRRAAAGRGRLRGIGLACYLEASGGGAAPKDQVAAEFDADGTLHLYGMTGPSGQGHETSFVDLVAAGLGLARAHVRYHASDPLRPLVGNGTGGSRSLYGAGSAFKNLVPAIIEQARPFAARLLAAPAADLDWRDGGFARADGRHLPLPELARLLAGAEPHARPHPLDCGAEAVSGVTFPNGCHIAELEIDPETGATTVIAYSAIDDLGHVVSPQLVRGQVHGGVMQGAGQAFGEQAVYERETGQLLTGSFMDYPMPRAAWAFEIRCEQHPVPTALNSLGAKGVGESGCSGSLPALANAMADALRPLGIGPVDMPYTPARVWRWIREARGR